MPAPVPAVGAGEQQCHPSVSSAAAGIVNVHPFSYGPKDTLAAAPRGADLVTGTEKPAWKCSRDNAAGALNFTPWPLIWGIFFQLRGKNSSLATCWGAVVADSKLPFPNTAFPQHQPLPVAPCPQTPEGTLVRGTAASLCWKTRAVDTCCAAGAPSHLINDRERSKELFPCIFGNCWAGCGKQSTGNLPLDQLELQALFHE